jgi:hypothetical protein
LGILFRVLLLLCKIVCAGQQNSEALLGFAPSNNFFYKEVPENNMLGGVDMEDFFVVKEGTNQQKFVVLLFFTLWQVGVSHMG